MILNQVMPTKDMFYKNQKLMDGFSSKNLGVIWVTQKL